MTNGLASYTEPGCVRHRIDRQPTRIQLVRYANHALVGGRERVPEVADLYVSQPEDRPVMPMSGWPNLAERRDTADHHGRPLTPVHRCSSQAGRLLAPHRHGAANVTSGPGACRAPTALTPAAPSAVTRSRRAAPGRPAALRRPAPTTARFQTAVSGWPAPARADTTVDHRPIGHVTGTLMASGDDLSRVERALDSCVPRLGMRPLIHRLGRPWAKGRSWKVIGSGAGGRRGDQLPPMAGGTGWLLCPGARTAGRGNC
jgi:hypothetical protein